MFSEDGEVKDGETEELDTSFLVTETVEKLSMACMA
jgi:hypothetical protein